jgi:Lipocalin-like domain
MTPLQDRLAGTFQLVSLETRRSDGVVSHPFGRRVIGSFMFDRAGNFAVQLMGDQPMAMFGTYAVDETQRTFTLTPAGALDPAVIGTEVIRHVEPGDGDIAVFRTPAQVTGDMESTTFITWRKISAG